jgi:hypothetical protein
MTKSGSNYQQLLDRIEALPGVRSVAASSATLLDNDKYNWPITVPGHEKFWVSTNPVTSRFFETLNIPLVTGRAWRRQDDYRPVREAVVSESLARYGSATSVRSATACRPRRTPAS